MAPPGVPQVGYARARGAGEPSAGGAGALGSAVLVKPARLGSSVGITPSATPTGSRGSRRRVRPRPAGHHRGVSARGSRSSAPSSATRRPRSRARRDRPRRRRLVRLRGQVQAPAACASTSRRGSRTRRRARPPLAGDAFLRVGCSGLARGRLLRRRRTTCSMNESTRCRGTPRRRSTRTLGRTAVSYADLVEGCAGSRRRFERRQALLLSGDFRYSADLGDLGGPWPAAARDPHEVVAVALAARCRASPGSARGRVSAPSFGQPSSFVGGAPSARVDLALQPGVGGHVDARAATPGFAST